MFDRPPFESPTFNRKDIIERLWKGRQERVRQGKPAGGNVPYGYRRNGKSFVVDSGEAQIVRRIFDMSADGASLSQIARELHRRGDKRRDGGVWTRNRIQAILARSDLYLKGRLRYGEVEGLNEHLILISKDENL